MVATAARPLPAVEEKREGSKKPVTRGAESIEMNGYLGALVVAAVLAVGSLVAGGGSLTEGEASQRIEQAAQDAWRTERLVCSTL